MVAGARTFSIEETLLEPPAINPPPTRHALFVFLIALAALLHLTTIGWGDLYGHTEGQYAGAAREMIEAHQWLSPTNDGLPRLQKPPLLYWLIIASFKFFGASAANPCFARDSSALPPADFSAGISTRKVSRTSAFSAISAP